MIKVPEDRPHFRADIEHMTDEYAEKWIIDIRNRRMRVVLAHQEATRLKEIADTDRKKIMAEKVETALRKALATADKALSKAEEKATQLRALRLQIEDQST